MGKSKKRIPNRLPKEIREKKNHETADWSLGVEERLARRKKVHLAEES